MRKKVGAGNPKTATMMVKATVALWDACGSNDLMVAVAEPLLAQQLQY
jgi:hypothetical protein